MRKIETFSKSCEACGNVFVRGQRESVVNFQSRRFCCFDCGRDTVKTHSRSRTPEYQSWRSLRRRCSDPTCPGYKDWGGRGITVCERWSNFEAFFEDMGPKPKGPRISVERIDNSKGYTPENCKWGTPIEQSRNRRSTKITLEKARRIRLLWLVGFRGELVEMFGVCRRTIYDIAAQKLWKEEKQESDSIEEAQQ